MKLVIAAHQDLNQHPTAPSTAFNRYFYPGQEARVKAAFASFLSDPKPGELWNPIFDNGFISIGPQSADVDLVQCEPLVNTRQINDYFLQASTIKVQ